MESPSYPGTMEASTDGVWYDDASSVKCEYYMFRTKAAVMSHNKASRNSPDTIWINPIHIWFWLLYVQKFFTC